MAAFAQVAELMDHRVFEDGLRGEDQVPVEVDLTVIPAAPPEVLLILDQDAFGPHAIPLSVRARIRGDILTKAFA
jgi:hypothetical protein